MTFRCRASPASPASTGSAASDAAVARPTAADASAKAWETASRSPGGQPQPARHLRRQPGRHPVTVPNSDAWHGRGARTAKAGAADTAIHHRLDGRRAGRRRAPDLVGGPMDLIAGPRTKCSSDPTGPTGDTYHRAWNVHVGRSDNG